jgi:glycosyltransferase involved in cell wall biosynthesis
MIKELKSSACFVLSSRWEGQPISIFLAMAAKLPVITTNVADNHHYIKPNVNGYLVSTENPIGFAKAIIKIIQNPIKAKRMGQLNYQIVKNNYTWDIVAQKVWRIYKKLI